MEYDNLVFTHYDMPYILFKKEGKKNEYHCTCLTKEVSTIDTCCVSKGNLDEMIRSKKWIPQFNMVDVCKEVFPQ